MSKIKIRDKRFRAGKEVEKLLNEETDFNAHKKVMTRWHTDELFGCMDIVAVAKDAVKLISITSNDTDGRLEELGEKEFLPFECGDVDVEVWVKHDYAGWVVHRFVDGEWEKAIDERGRGYESGMYVVEQINNR